MKKNIFLNNKSLLGRKLFILSLLTAIILSSVAFARAQTNPPVAKNDFILEPGKVEMFVNPGDTLTKSITVTNRAAGSVSFKIEIEDFIGSNDQNKPVVLLGNEKSPTSFKDNVVPTVKNFTLAANASLNIPININVPKDAQPGGFYTSVLVSNEPSVTLEGKTANAAEGTTKVISRVGTLFFIRVNGVANESGALDDFKMTRPTNEAQDLYKFNILFRNDGNVHLVPFGWVTVTNLFGKTVGKVPVDAYFAMPKSIRYRDIEWTAPFLFGRYEATVNLNRGYGSNLVDTKTISFWVIPWKITVTVLAVLLVIILLVYVFFKKFKLVAKKE